MTILKDAYQVTINIIEKDFFNSRTAIAGDIIGLLVVFLFLR